MFALFLTFLKNNLDEIGDLHLGADRHFAAQRAAVNLYSFFCNAEFLSGLPVGDSVSERECNFLFACSQGVEFLQYFASVPHLVRIFFG